MGHQVAQSQEKRKSERYGSKAEISYYYSYDIDTKVKFQKITLERSSSLLQKFTAICKNVSVDGLCFISPRQLDQGDLLNLEVYLPKVKDPTQLTGEVRWSQRIESGDDFDKQYDTGIKLITVEGKPVRESVYYDNEYKVEWSAVLESILGKYRLFTHRKENKS